MLVSRVNKIQHPGPLYLHFLYETIPLNQFFKVKFLVTERWWLVVVGEPHCYSACIDPGPRYAQGEGGGGTFPGTTSVHFTLSTIEEG